MNMEEKLSVLVVDDESVMRSSLSEWLGDEGFTVRTAESGPKALELLDEEVANVAIVDIKMPEMDGITLLKKIREKGIDMPIIMLTAYATIESAIQSMKEGAYDYLMKPFPPEKLTLLIRRTVEHQRLTKENLRLQSERKTFLRLAFGVIVVIAVIGVIYYFIFAP